MMAIDGIGPRVAKDGYIKCDLIEKAAEGCLFVFPTSPGTIYGFRNAKLL